MEQFYPWLGPLVGAVALGYTIHSNRSKAASDKVTTMEGRIEKVEARTAQIQSDMKHLPDIQVTHRLELAIAALGTQLKVLDERIKPVAAVSERLQEILLERVNGQ